MSYTRTGHPLAIAPNCFKAIELFDIAADKGLPKAVGYGRVMTVTASLFGVETVYDLNGMITPPKSEETSIQPDEVIAPPPPKGAKPRTLPAANSIQAACVYYVAYNIRNKRSEFVISPLLVDQFCDHVQSFLIAASNFYGISGHVSKQKIKSARMADAALRGDVKGLFKNWGAAWLAALQDPEWWMEATVGTSSYVPASRFSTRMAQHEMAMQRALRTRHAEIYNVSRSIRVLDKPETFWHIITSDKVPFSTFGQIRKSGGLKLSTDLRNGAHYGVGAYAYGAHTPRPASLHYFEFKAPAGTAVELIEAPTGSFYRLLPPEGNILKVDITKHSFTPDEVKMGDMMAAD